MTANGNNRNGNREIMFKYAKFAAIVIAVLLPLIYWVAAIRTLPGKVSNLEARIDQLEFFEIVEVCEDESDTISSYQNCLISKWPIIGRPMELKRNQ